MKPIYDISLLDFNTKNLIYTYKTDTLPMIGDYVSHKFGDILYEVKNRMMLGVQNSYNIVLFVHHIKLI